MRSATSILEVAVQLEQAWTHESIAPSSASDQRFASVAWATFCARAADALFLSSGYERAKLFRAIKVLLTFSTDPHMVPSLVRIACDRRFTPEERRMCRRAIVLIRSRCEALRCEVPLPPRPCLIQRQGTTFQYKHPTEALRHVSEWERDQGHPFDGTIEFIPQEPLP